MKNVLIINGHQYYPQKAEGKLTGAVIDRADTFLSAHGFDVKHSKVQSDYSIEEEVAKFDWADIFIIQYPVFWMGVPWITKKYIDEIFSAGNGSVTFVDDGRSRSDASKRYGSGGLMQQKQYMLSLTYNCPKSEFDNKAGFFEGLSLDEANVATHKTFQFCGASPKESFAVYDVFKGDLDLQQTLAELEKRLEKNFLT
ncbi:MAG: NAD(P)H-dependent oxidoreductase [Campylobacterota bacterium]